MVDSYKLSLLIVACVSLPCPQRRTCAPTPSRVLAPAPLRASPPTGTWVCPRAASPHGRALFQQRKGLCRGRGGHLPRRSGTLCLPRFPLFPFGPGPAHLEAGSAAAWERFHQLGPRNAELFNLSIPRCTEAPGCLGPAAFGTAALDKQRAAPALSLRLQLQPGLGTGGRRRLA